jgi:hypothetical protein
VASALAVAYTAWVFTGRFFERKAFEKRVDNKGVNPEFERLYGGNTVRILQFYARDGQLKSGESTLLCYGVLNASSVQVEPHVEGVYPSAGRCIEITPTRSTEYSLKAEGPKGAPVSQKLTIVVR